MFRSRLDHRYGGIGPRAALECGSLFIFVAVLTALSARSAGAQAVTVSVDVNNRLAVMPEYGLGVHASVYDNSLQYTGSAAFNQLDSQLDAAGVNVLRYPGGGYADVFHFSVSRSGGLAGNGLTPWWGEPTNFGYMGAKTDFGNFIKLLDATSSKTIITLNTGGALKYASANQLGVPTHGGQPQEAAAWVAYANGDASMFGTPQDISLGVDSEGNNWKTAGYWAKLRASSSSEYVAWATAGGVYDSRNAFLAIDRDAPTGIKYWEIGNETFGSAYYGGDPTNRGYALNYAAPYNGSDGTLRDDNLALSPAAYGQQVNAFTAAMRAVDPSIKVGAVLATPRTDVNTPIGDYTWSFADLNDNGVKESNEPYWNDEVLSHTDGLGKVADNVDFVIAHWYPNGNANTIVNEPRLQIPTMLNGVTAGLDSGTNAGLRDSIAHWRTDGDGKALEVLITETDGYGGTTQRSDGLFAADAYATFMDNGVSNVDWLELHNGSFLSEAANAPNFAYWGVQSVHLMAKPGDDLASTTTTDANVRVHAAVQPNGAVAVMIINMNATSGGTRTVSVSINGGTLSNNGVQYQTDGDSALVMSSLATLGNSFTTNIAGRTLQLFVIPPRLPGDFDGNGVVDAADLAIWSAQFGQTGSPQADANGDRTVDGADFFIWQQNAQATMTAAALSDSAAVPEPSSAAILATYFFIICWRGIEAL
jgi:hypothetical protein